MEKKTTSLEKQPEVVSSEIIHSLVINGDLSKMSPDQKVQYYNHFCQSLGLNPLTQPFQLITFQGKQRLYATKDCTEQLRKIHSVSITDVTAQELRGVYVVTAKAKDKSGKTDAATGAVSIEGLKGEALANALMKAETKSKRRVTLSICGLGILDESETDSIGQFTTTSIAEVVSEKPKTSRPDPITEGLSAEEKYAKETDAHLRALIDTANQLDSLDAFLRFSQANVEWENVEGYDLAMIEAKKRIDAMPKPVTINQKTQILLLLNNSVITTDEKEKMKDKLNTFDTVRADQAIAKLKKVIQERTKNIAA